jgi:hypothetical protein
VTVTVRRRRIFRIGHLFSHIPLHVVVQELVRPRNEILPIGCVGMPAVVLARHASWPSRSPAFTGAIAHEGEPGRTKRQELMGMASTGRRGIRQRGAS